LLLIELAHTVAADLYQGASSSSRDGQPLEGDE
jgi:hypothetical protein